jgi:hypothetical protein
MVLVLPTYQYRPRFTSFFVTTPMWTKWLSYGKSKRKVELVLAGEEFEKWFAFIYFDCIGDSFGFWRRVGICVQLESI